MRNNGAEYNPKVEWLTFTHSDFILVVKKLKFPYDRVLVSGAGAWATDLALRFFTRRSCSASS